MERRKRSMNKEVKDKHFRIYYKDTLSMNIQENVRSN